jgi:ADP-ribose pyrophosphatase YjhB (NUDIX family)
MAVRRFGARVVMLDPQDRELLFRLVNPRSGNTWWATPGGGVEKGERSAEAARRELKEETSVDAEGLVGPIWIDEHWFRSGKDLIHQQDRYFLVRVEKPEIDVSGLDAIETDMMVEHRWWTLDDLEGTDSAVYPRGLAGHLRDLLRHGPPERPLKLAR